MTTIFRILRVIAIFVLACHAAVRPADAQSIGITLGDSAQIRVAPGAVVVVPIRVEVSAGAAEGIASLGGLLTWSATRLRLDSVRTAEAGWTVTANVDSAISGRVQLSLYNATALATSSVVARAYFTATTQVGGTRLQFSPTVAGSELGASILDRLAPRPLDACVAPSGRWGDVTDDGAVNVIDAQQIARFSVGLPVGNATALAARGDVTADGAINVIDAQQIARFSVSLSAASRISSSLFEIPIASAVALAPGIAPVVRLGERLQLVADPQDASGASIAGCPSFRYVSETPGVAAVSGSGSVTGVTTGQAWITVTTPGIGSSRVLVRVANAAGVQAPEAVLAVGTHGCALSVAGSAHCWGANTTGQLGDGTTEDRLTPIVAAPGLTFTAIATGASFSCGLTASGAAICWGANSLGQLGDGTTVARSTPAPVAGGHVFVSLVMSSSHACGLTADGGAWCWGQNSSSQLGDGIPGDGSSRWSSVPVVVAGGLRFSRLAVGGGHSCGITAAGTAHCWGSNASGQLGDRTTTTAVAPVPVSTALRFTSIAAGNLHTCGLTALGVTHCWGANTDGQLGDGTTTANSFPVAVAGALRFSALSAGGSTSCGLTTFGSAHCWGSNGFGQIGDGTTDRRLAPVQVSGNSPFAAIGTSGAVSCGLTRSGAVSCWGSRSRGALADGTTTIRQTPTLVSGGVAFTQLSASITSSNSCGISISGAAYCWGDNIFGQIGDGTVGGQRFSPVQVLGDLTFRSLTGSTAHTCGVSASGVGYCWGWGRQRLGIDSVTTERYFPTPLPISGGRVWSQLAAAVNESCGLVTTGEVYCWGRTATPVLLPGGISFSALSGGNSQWCGLSVAGAGYCWGSNASGQLGNGTTTSTTSSEAPSAILGGLAFSSLSVGANVACGITAAGAAHCWGNNANGQVGDGTTNGSPSPVAVTGGFIFRQLSAGSQHACAIATTGVTYCWGWNSSGQLGDGTMTNRAVPTAVQGGLSFVALASGQTHTCGVLASGAAYCWGEGRNGALGGLSVTINPIPTPISANGVTFRTP